jgi:methylthioribose-1-phosphate isomerase
LTLKNRQIRGAPAIASLASLSIASHLSLALKASPRPGFLASASALKAHVEPLLAFLYTSRPTAVNLGTATRRIQQKLDTLVGQSESSSGGSVDEVVQGVVLEARAIADEDVGRNKEMSRLGAEWLLAQVEKAGLQKEGKGLNILTVCNTGSLATSVRLLCLLILYAPTLYFLFIKGYGTALGLITYLSETQKLDRAYYTQTAPYHQGSRLTSLELQTLKIPSTMICDTMVGSLFQHHEIHAVVVGADRVVENGDTANKASLFTLTPFYSHTKFGLAR